MQNPKEHRDHAQSIVSNQTAVPQEFEEFKALVVSLKGAHEFGLARKLLLAGRSRFAAETDEIRRKAEKGPAFGEKADSGVWLIQQQALCTYKDEELQPAKRFQEALSILDEIGLRDKSTTNAETLALGGAIYRRMWEHGGKLDHLYRALSFYQAAWEADEDDVQRCYGGINAAFINDQMAFRLRGLAATELQSGEGRKSVNEIRAEAHCKEAIGLRKAILAELERRESKNPDYWFAVTRAESFLGLALAKNIAEKDPENLALAKEWYGNAAKLLADGKESDKEWRLQTTFKQTLTLARLHGYVPGDKEKWEPVAAVFDALLGYDAKQAVSCQRGKVGLALSGGGFRASFYHLGVMARLAEMDVLRGIEVLSTVSGGSILGAQYYLEIQNLLQTHADAEISRELYIDVVKRLQTKFLAGVERNLRVRTFSSLRTNLRMLFDGYSRTHRLGELYEKELYSHVADNHRPGEERLMNQLLIVPADEKARNEKFHPLYDNWRRAAKVPVLLLNSTALNTGHNWQFTAKWMGEPPGLLRDGVDTNERYRRLNYDEAPDAKLRQFRLGYAVAASSCVPGLFDPICLQRLYPGATVRLVDGGVHDNQGIAGLLNEGCTRILCSDASGQMPDEKSPADNFVGVPLRVSSILQSRVREAQLLDLQGRAESHALEGLFFVHLKKDLETEPIDWINCQNPNVPPASYSSTTPYGIDRDLQRQLSDMRTDLDSFTEVEAYSLMLSGYLMTAQEFKKLQQEHVRQGLPGNWGGYDIDAPRQDWTFLELEKIMRKPADSSDARRTELGRQLKASSLLFLKIWELNKTLKAVAIATVIALGGLLIIFLHSHWGSPIFQEEGKFTWGDGFLSLFMLALGIFAPVFQFLNPRKAMKSSVQKFAVAVIGWAFAKIHLCFFDKMFLRQGRLKRLLELPDE